MSYKSECIREYVSPHIRLNSKQKLIYLVDDGNDLSNLERFCAQSYMASGYRIRIIKKADIRNKEWFIGKCKSNRERSQFQSILDEAQNETGKNAHLIAFRKAVDWFYEQHPDLEPASRKKYRLKESTASTTSE